jgi:hypothetical protein
VDEAILAQMIASNFFGAAAQMAGMVIGMILMLVIFITFRDEFLVFRDRDKK